MKTLLKNGLVYDGTGSRGNIADILIEGERIIKIGDLWTTKADAVHDLSGLSVAPGFIDAHSHNDFYAIRPDADKFFASFVEQGITTQIVGNCGFSAFGFDKDTEFSRLIGGGLFELPGDAPDYARLDDYIKAAGPAPVNLAPLIGHGTARISVSGYGSGSLAEHDMKKLLRLTEEAMRSGAFGGSLGLMYEPGTYSKTEELVKFAEMIKRYDGILTVHARACSSVSMAYPLLGKSHLVRAFEEIMKIVEKTGVRCEYSHLIFVGEKSWKQVDKVLKILHSFQGKGYDVGFDLYSYNFGASVLTVALPAWYMSMTPEQKNSKATKTKVTLLVNITKKLLGIEFKDMKIAFISDEHREFEGKTVAEIAVELKKSELETYLDLINLSGGKGRMLFDKYYNDKIVVKLMKEPSSVFMTDAWYEEHGCQNASAYGSFPAFSRSRERRISPSPR